MHNSMEFSMTIVSIKEARSNIGLLIEKAEHGEEILITRRGKQVARLQGIKQDRPRLTKQADFRKSIKISGGAMSSTVIQNR